MHETDGLIETAKELGVAYVAYSPLGHGWLVDDFPYKSPDDFAPDDFRRRGILVLRTRSAADLPELVLTSVSICSSQVPGRKLLQEQGHRRPNQDTRLKEGLYNSTDRIGMGRGSGNDSHPWYNQGEAAGGELGVA